MRNLWKQAVELARDLRENGLNGVEFIHVGFSPPTDPADDDLGREMAAAWDRDYCCMQLCADTEPFCGGFDSDHPYLSTTFDRQSFTRDLRDKFAEYFGEELIVEMEKFYGWEPNFDDGDTEVYRRSSPWEDFDGNKYGRPVDPLCENL